jgi:hypothetical protein
MKIYSRRQILSVAASVAVLVGPFGHVLALAGDDSSAIWDHDGTRAALITEIQKFFGRTTGRYLFSFYENDNSASTAVRAANGEFLIFDQFMAVFGGPAEHAVALSNGRRLLIATMPHDSSQQALVVTSGDSTEIVAAAMVYLFCPEGGVIKPTTPTQHVACADKSALTIFYPRASGQDTQLTDDITNWVLKDQQERHAPVGIHAPRRINRFIRKL